MNFCVNCGKNYAEKPNLCDQCYSAPTLPNEIIFNRFVNTSHIGDNISFGFPGEKSALIFSLFISIVLIIISGFLSFGIVLLFIIVNLIILRIQHITYKRNKIKISVSQFAKVHNLSLLASYRLNLNEQEVFITEDFQYNAFTMGFLSYGFVVINAVMVKDFTPDELLFVIGHELGHIKKKHTTWLNLSNPIKTKTANFIFAPVMKLIFNVWGIKAEYTADQAGLLACNSLDACISCLLKLSGGREVDKYVNIKTIIQSLEKNSEISGDLYEYFGSHPFIENRMKQLINFSKSSDYLSNTKK